MCCREYCSNMMQYVWYLWGSGRGQKGGEIDETEMELFPRIPIPLNPPYFIWEIYRFSSKNFTFHKTWQTKYKGPFWIHWAFFGVLLGRTSFAFVISSILLVFRRNVFSFNFDHFNHHRHLLLIVIITFVVRLSSDFSLEVLDLEHGDAGNYICEVDCQHNHHCHHIPSRSWVRQLFRWTCTASLTTWLTPCLCFVRTQNDTFHTRRNILCRKISTCQPTPQQFGYADQI